MKNIFVSALVICAAILFSNNTSARISTDTVKKITLKVTNLHCNNDMPTIKKRLLNQDGIDEVLFTDIAGESSVFTITYHSSATSEEQIEKTVESTPGCDNKNEMPYRVKKGKKRS
jgi:copper chaperone CopZ